MNYYFENASSERCFAKDHFMDLMTERGETQMTVFKAKIEYHTDYFYCRKLDDIGDKSEGGCGKWCCWYKPRNGKNGRCIHNSSCYEITEEAVLLVLKKVKST